MGRMLYVKIMEIKIEKAKMNFMRFSARLN